MKLTEPRAATALFTRRINVAEGPVHPMAYSSTGKTFRVERVGIDYNLAKDGTWQVVRESSVWVTGTVLKKDGSDSRNDHTRTPRADPGTWGAPVTFTGEWEWLNSLIDAARPVGAVTLPALGG